MISKGKFLQNANFLFAFFIGIFFTFSFRRKVVVFYPLIFHYTAIASILFFYLIHVIKNTSSNNHSCFCIVLAIFFAVTSPQDNIAINPSISTVRRFSALYSVVFLMMHIPPFLRILLHHLPDSGYARCQYTLLFV